MVPFSIAGIQTHVAALHSNVDALLHKLELTVAQYPWVQMVVMSELRQRAARSQFGDSDPNCADGFHNVYE
ncbi:MAG: hypothetical protein OEW68_16995 [Gammaproteobacteria bacterium]|nr:hypothetical protein [Gammaproteobacteria bacterium]MDH4316513.1 hypothetical protein [Gammaproteobacteria bacterium]MDH5215553.1 hypothetical protein [Gammaproteobacteria bacterium]